MNEATLYDFDVNTFVEQFSFDLWIYVNMNDLKI